MDTAPSWPEILFLMVHGPALTMRGRIRHGDGDVGRSFAFSRRDGDPRPVFVHSSYDVIDAWRSGNCLRVADPDGQVRLITDGTTAWTFTDDAERPAESPHRNVGFGLSGTDLLVRTDAERWLHDDFTHPTGPPVATTFLGRRAWEIEFAPPQHKPHPMQLVIDAETGMQLQRRNDAFGAVSEWVELTMDEDLDPALFTWTGPVVTWEEQREQSQREIAADRARSARWAVEQLGTEKVTVTVEVAVEIHRLEDDGSLYASLGSIGTLLRRPRSDAPWDELDDLTGAGGPADRWSDSTWDWALHAWETPLAPGALEQLQAQLGRG